MSKLSNMIKFSKRHDSSPSTPDISLDDILYKEEYPKQDIDADMRKYLEGMGYTLIERLDGEGSESEGHTSIVYLANFKSGDIDKKRVIKIPLNWIDSSSITTVINMSKKNVYHNEIKYAQHFSNELAHDNIIDVVDHLKFNDQDIIIENYMARSMSLKSSLKWGKFGDDKLRTIYNKILDGFEHMHKNDVIYRDGKSSNILVTQDGVVKIIDLQNCVDWYERVESSLPTKGGTAYSKREVINAIMNGDQVYPSSDMDMHSLGVMLYEMVTGRLPFDYKLKRAKEGLGKEISVNGKKYNIVLLRNNKPVDEITEEMYKEDVKNALNSLGLEEKNVLRTIRGEDYIREAKFRGMFERFFLGEIYTTKKSRGFYSNVCDIREDFNKLFDSTTVRLANTLYKSLKPALIAAIIVSGIEATILFSKKIDDGKPPRPTLSEMMVDKNYRAFGLENLKDDEYSYMWSILKPNIKDLKRKHDALTNTGDDYYTNYMPSYAKLAGRRGQMDSRLYTSLMRAIATTDTSRVGDYIKDRQWPTLMPDGFLIYDTGYKNSFTQNARFIPRKNRFKMNDLNIKMGLASDYLKANMGYDKDITDVLAGYVCSNTELATAKINSKSLKYFAYNEDNHIMPGYNSWISPLQRSIIEKAVILYHITDDDGNVDWNKLPKFEPRLGASEDAPHMWFTAYKPMNDTINKK